MISKVVTLKELGKNCWLPKRFISGSRCHRVFTCSYPEKKTCRAIEAEIAYLKNEQRRLMRARAQIDNTIELLFDML